MDILSINEQIAEVKNQRNKLKNEKKKHMAALKKEEELFQSLTEYKKYASKSIESFEDKLSVRCNMKQGNFGKYYKRKIQSTLKKSKAYDAENMAASALNTIKLSICNIDDTIGSIDKKIDGLNDLLKQLGDLLNEVKEVIDDSISGDDE